MFIKISSHLRNRLQHISGRQQQQHQHLLLVSSSLALQTTSEYLCQISGKNMSVCILRLIDTKSYFCCVQRVHSIRTTNYIEFSVEYSDTTASSRSYHRFGSLPAVFLRIVHFHKVETIPTVATTYCIYQLLIGGYACLITTYWNLRINITKRIKNGFHKWWNKPKVLSMEYIITSMKGSNGWPTVAFRIENVALLYANLSVKSSDAIYQIV